MAIDPGLGYRVVATVTGVKGKCNAGHRVGESFEISIHNARDLCGSFYHNIFPSLHANFSMQCQEIILQTSGCMPDSCA